MIAQFRFLKTIDMFTIVFVHRNEAIERHNQHINRGQTEKGTAEKRMINQVLTEMFHLMSGY